MGDVTGVATPKTSKKASKVGRLFVARCLRNENGIIPATETGFHSYSMHMTGIDQARFLKK